MTPTRECAGEKGGRSCSGGRTEQQVQEVQSLCEPQVVQALEKHVSKFRFPPTNHSNIRAAQIGKSGSSVPRVHFEYWEV